MGGRITQAVSSIEHSDELGNRTATGDQDRLLIRLHRATHIQKGFQTSGQLGPVEQAAADLDDEQARSVHERGFSRCRPGGESPMPAPAPSGPNRSVASWTRA